ncbi:MAG: acetolactate synthase small subunit [Erysipelotrichaceae bacterium]
MNDTKFAIGILVSNHFGVLLKVVGLFSRRGFNIDSLTVGETQNPDLSRITIVSSGDEHVQDQIVHQLEKLFDVKKVEVMDPHNTVHRELILVKISMVGIKRSDVLEAVNVFRAKVVDYNLDSITVEITGENSKLQAFVEYVNQFGVIEMTRTGITAMGRNNSCLK